MIHAKEATRLPRGYYRPQRSCGQGNIFAPVCHSVHRGGVCLSACWDTTPPPWSRHLPEQTPPRSRHPLPQTPPPPRRDADSGIWSMSGRYASYWNAFLLTIHFLSTEKTTPSPRRQLSKQESNKSLTQDSDSSTTTTTAREAEASLLITGI